jgi:hypothetical protein
MENTLDIIKKINYYTEYKINDEKFINNINNINKETENTPKKDITKIEESYKLFNDFHKNVNNISNPQNNQASSNKISLTTEIKELNVSKVSIPNNNDTENYYNTLISNHKSYNETLKNLQSQNNNFLDYFDDYIKLKVENLQVEYLQDNNTIKNVNQLYDYSITLTINNLPIDKYYIMQQYTEKINLNKQYNWFNEKDTYKFDNLLTLTEFTTFILDSSTLLQEQIKQKTEQTTTLTQQEQIQKQQEQKKKKTEQNTPLIQQEQKLIDKNQELIDKNNQIKLLNKQLDKITEDYKIIMNELNTQQKTLITITEDYKIIRNELNTQKEQLKINESNKTKIKENIDKINKPINNQIDIPLKINTYNWYVKKSFDNNIEIFNNVKCINKLENKLSERFTDLKKQENINNYIYNILQRIDENKEILENKLVLLKLELNSLTHNKSKNNNKGTQFVNINQLQISDKLKNEIKALNNEIETLNNKIEALNNERKKYYDDNDRLAKYFKSIKDTEIRNIKLTHDLQNIIDKIPELNNDKFKILTTNNIKTHAFNYISTEIEKIDEQIKEIENQIKEIENTILLITPKTQSTQKLEPMQSTQTPTFKGGSDINIDDKANANAKKIINEINKLIISIYNKILDINNKNNIDGDKVVNIVVNIDGDKDGDKDVIIDGDTFFNKKINKSVVSLKKSIIEFNYLLFYTHVLFIIFYVYNDKNKIIKPIISFKELVNYYCIIDVLLLNKKKTEFIYIFFYKYHYLNLKIVYNFFKKIIDKIINHNNEEIKQLIVINNYEKIIINLFNIDYTDSMKKAIIIFIALRPILLECYNLIINEQKDRQKYIFDKINSKILDKINSN